MYLQRFVLRPEVVSQLRALLGQESFSVWRLGDHEVIRQCAALLVQRRLCVVRTEAAVASVRQAAGSARPETAETKTPQPRPRTLQPAVVQPAPPEANPLDRVDHDAQAMVLVRAARDGVPFCEECEKARRQLAEAAEVLR